MSVYARLCSCTISCKPALSLGCMIDDGTGCVRACPACWQVDVADVQAIDKRLIAYRNLGELDAAKAVRAGRGGKGGGERRAGQARCKPYSRISISSSRREVIAAVGNKRMQRLRMVVPYATAPCWHLGARLRTCFAVANTLHPACYRLHACFNTRPHMFPHLLPHLQASAAAEQEKRREAKVKARREQQAAAEARVLGIVQPLQGQAAS